MGHAMRRIGDAARSVHTDSGPVDDHLDRGCPSVSSMAPRIDRLCRDRSVIAPIELRAGMASHLLSGRLSVAYRSYARGLLAPHHRIPVFPVHRRLRALS